MNPRSLKRVLVGETSLERKCRWWFGIALGVLLVLSFYASGQQLRDFLRGTDHKLGRVLVDAAFIERHFIELMQPSADEKGALRPEEIEAWKELIGGVTSRKKDKEKEGETGQGNEAPTDPEEAIEYESFAIKPQDPLFNPNGYGRPDHDFEWNYLREFEDPKPDAQDFKNRYDDDGKLWRYYQAIYAKKQCITCHSAWGEPARPGLAEGDLLAVMRIEVDRTEGLSDIAKYDALMWGFALVIGMLSMLLLWFIVKLLIVKPVNHLREVANAVREGDTSQRADIQTGDEFEDLAAAFNRMLRQLLSQQNSLEGVNQELDAKVDELAQMNLRLFEMNRLKSDFLATMSHELRTPLNSILGFSEVLATVDSLDAKQRRYVGNIQRSGKMLLGMINDILDLAKLESGRMDASPTELPLAAIVTAQCDMARPLAERKNIDLDADCETGTPPLRQDQTKLQQVLNNLLSNAIKFTPEGGRIMVRAHRETDPHAPRPGDAATLVLEVEDTGIGISEADQAIIFEKFRQGASAAPGGDAMTRELGGAGLGLSIVRELCRLLGGDVSVRSVVGKGSTFTVRLPWRLPDRSDLDAELQRGVAELTRPTAPAVAHSVG